MLQVKILNKKNPYLSYSFLYKTKEANIEAVTMIWEKTISLKKCPPAIILIKPNTEPKTIAK